MSIPKGTTWEAFKGPPMVSNYAQDLPEIWIKGPFRPGIREYVYAGPVSQLKWARRRYARVLSRGRRSAIRVNIRSSKEAP